MQNPEIRHVAASFCKIGCLSLIEVINDGKLPYPLGYQ